MEHVDKLRESFPEEAKDIKINLSNVLAPGTLNAAQVWGTAIACAYAARNADLVSAIVEDAKRADVPKEVIDDARAAAVMMAMNNVYYRFRHIVDKEEYSHMPARLRMQRLARPSTNKADFELFCLAVSAINNCQTCVRAHEATVVSNGLTNEHVHDAVRIAATIAASAAALESIRPF
jgi:lipoyl-dependent peroxiredoxin subunit D